ncbi:MAG: DUF4126 domain-containing protein [Candidatus Nanopelagicales bacterium]
MDIATPFDTLADPWVLGPAGAGGRRDPGGQGSGRGLDQRPATDCGAPGRRCGLFVASTSLGTNIPPSVSLIAGLLTAGTVHGTKAALRPVLNAGSPGVAAPVVSISEEVVSTALSFAAVFAPFLVLTALVGFVWLVTRRLVARRPAQELPRLDE